MNQLPVKRERSRAVAVLGLAAALAAGVGLGLAPSVRAASPPPGPTGYTSTLLHFAVHVGPGLSQTCDIVGEMFRPAGSGPSHRVPAILTTNGFGGSYQDQIGIAELFARQGYAVLTYSGLGFGGSGCKITLDDPDYDGAAASQLVSYLGGDPGIAFYDAAHTAPVPTVDFVTQDRTDHAGRSRPDDPRVGMVGGSYGGEVQFAAASVDARIDTIVPLITWNDLAYSLAPNDAGNPPGTGTPGVAKSTWALLFSSLGIADGLQQARADAARNIGCPNFADWVCPGLVHAATLGYPDPATLAHLEHASVASYMPRVRVPTLLLQGENDTLFNLNEAAATYQALAAEGTPVSMIWQSWGHSGSTPAPGELDLTAPDPSTQYEAARVAAWFDHYLRGSAVPTGPGFAYFRDWVPYTGNAAPAYASAPSYPVGRPVSLYLSRGGTLTGVSGTVPPSAQTFVTPALGAPAGIAPPDGIGSSLPASVEIPEIDLPGTFAAWKTLPLTDGLDVVGAPVLHIKVSAPTADLTERVGPAGDLVLFAKLYDVAPDGAKSLIHGLVAPFRLADAGQPVTVTMPGIVHRFAPGHRIELDVSGGDLNYRGGMIPTPVTISTGSTAQVLTLPTA